MSARKKSHKGWPQRYGNRLWIIWVHLRPPTYLYPSTYLRHAPYLCVLAKVLLWRVTALAHLSFQDQLLFCDDCDRGYHMYCLTPPLSAPPEGEHMPMLRVPADFVIMLHYFIVLLRPTGLTFFLPYLSDCRYLVLMASFCWRFNEVKHVTVSLDFGVLCISMLAL